MAYNKAKEEKKWRLWKEAEEKQLRSLGVNEDDIEKLRVHDWTIFNSDRRYYQRVQETGTYLDELVEDTTQPEVKTVEDFLDSIENQHLYQVLIKVDRLTLQIALMKIQGYSTREIAVYLDITEKAVYRRMDALVLVYVGRMAKEKNIEELLEYQQDAGKSGVILVLVGDGPYLPELKKKVEELKLAKNVIFTGMITPEEVGRYYQAGDLFVSASISETQGMTYAEALAGGIPLLCRRDGCLEQVVTDGENGWQYDKKEDYLMRIQEWKGMGENARSRMQNKAAISAEKFSSGNFAERVEKIYEQQIRKYRYENAA